MSICYLICSIDTEDDLAFHVKDWPVTFKPSSVPAKVIEGWGNLRLKILDAEVSFSDEMSGVQICFEGGNVSPLQAAQIVEEMCENASYITGIPSRVIAT